MRKFYLFAIIALSLAIPAYGQNQQTGSNPKISQNQAISQKQTRVKQNNTKKPSTKNQQDLTKSDGKQIPENLQNSDGKQEYGKPDFKIGFKTNGKQGCQPPKQEQPVG